MGKDSEGQNITKEDADKLYSSTQGRAEVQRYRREIHQKRGIWEARSDQEAQQAYSTDSGDDGDHDIDYSVLKI